jgi:transposase
LVGKGRSKTDSSDAELLYLYGIERGEREAEQLVNDPQAEAIQARLACYRVAQKSRVAYQNVLEALSQDPATSTDLLEEVNAEIRELKGKEKRQVVAATKLVGDDSDSQHRFELLLTIPGVGPITALTLVTLFRKYGTASRSQIVALAGFDPIQIRSGTSVHRKSRISKRGNREVRRRLYEATLSAARYNPSIRAIYRRLKDQGKPDKVARTAAARKLLVIAHAIYKRREPYRAPAVVEG